LDGSHRIVPEYEVCKRIADDQGLPLRQVFDTIARCASETTGAE
jgi:uncharacterized protein (DUF111 family)